MTQRLVDDPQRERLVTYRRHLHAHPELSMEEHETAAFVQRELANGSFDQVIGGVGKTGVKAVLRGGRPGPVTLLRADMDALPVSEISEVPYRSTRDGVMHACGHDGHTAILLAAALELSRRRDAVAGTIVFCFQPGEEGSAGARLMIEDGVLENPHVDRVFALHLYSGLEAGRVGIRDGAFFASSDRFTIELTGRGGHGAMPQFSADPIVGAAVLVSALQTVASREVAPKDPVVVTVGSLHAGTTFNVIPDTARLSGTVRTLDEDVRRDMPERLERLTAGVSAAMRLEHVLQYDFGYPPTVNDRATNDVVRAVARAVVGPENVSDPQDIAMWSEDMSYMQQERPGAYFLIGSRGNEIGREPQHSARYDIDERALEVGFAMMVGIALAG
ncbi:MAG TPA: M20 family metallopeptidase [Candidatus Tumulicola sp.]